MSSNIVTLGDGLAGLELCRPGSVNLILSDLPSGETEAEFDTKPDLKRLWSAAGSALSTDGQVVLMASSIRFAGELIESNSRWFRYDTIWKKGRPTGFLNAKKRPLRAHEFVLVFSGKPGVYNPQKTTNCRPMNNTGTSDYKPTHNYGKHNRSANRAGSTVRLPTSVIDIKTIANNAKNKVHHQQKPASLMEYLILTYSNPGDMVFDPYAGSGSAGYAAQKLGRRFIGYDINPRFGASSET